MPLPRTRFTRSVGIDVPVVLGAFGGLSSVALTAAVSNAGGLGSYGLYGYGAERILATAADLRAATERPFVLNAWLPHDGSEEQHPSRADFDAWLEPLLPYYAELGVPTPEPPEAYLPSFAEQFEAILEARPAVFSFVYGVPTPDVVERCREAGIRTLGTATTVAEAVALDKAGVDAIVASGAEAGGHRVSFLAAAEDSLVGGLSLVPQVVDAVRAPVVAAGGIADRRGIDAVFALGAEAALLGTAFLACTESAASAAHRAMITGPEGRTTVLTRAFSGRLARGVPNRVTREVGTPAAPFPVQNFLTGKFKSVAVQQGVADLSSLWCGQSAGLVTADRSAAQLVADLVADPVVPTV
ncbi:MAG: NAD(P)H-dependent flavin oxidoreductase [Propionibacteriaceae bacterium]